MPDLAVTLEDGPPVARLVNKRVLVDAGRRYADRRVRTAVDAERPALHPGLPISVAVEVRIVPCNRLCAAVGRVAIVIVVAADADAKGKASAARAVAALQQATA